jgi:hypothetical protein
MIADKIWKLTNAVRVGLAPRSSHAQREATFPDNVCSYSPPVTVCHVMKIWLLFVFLKAQLQVYMQVQQVPNDTDPLRWWKQHQQEFPDLSRMDRHYLDFIIP